MHLDLIVNIDTVVTEHVNDNVTVMKLHDQSYFKTLKLSCVKLHSEQIDFAVEYVCVSSCSKDNVHWRSNSIFYVTDV